MSDIKDLISILDTRLNRNRWDLLYEYAIKALDQDIERFHKLDDKISKFLNTATIVIGVFIAAIPYSFNNYFPPQSSDGWFLFLMILLVFVALCCFWGFLFVALKIVDVPRMPFDNEIIKFVQENEKVNNVYLGLTKTCNKTLEENKIVNARKVNLLKKAYLSMSVAATMIVFSLLWLALLQYIK